MTSARGFPDDERRACPFCAESVKATAKICPFCQSRLVRHARWRQELMAGAPLLLVMVLLAGFIYWAERYTTPGRGRVFAPHRQELGVVRTQLIGSDSGVALTGWVTNGGAYPWRVHSLEVRFLNSDGSLRDVHEPSFADPFVVQPGQEAAFRVALGKLPEMVRTAAFEVRVRQATDGNLPRKTD